MLKVKSASELLTDEQTASVKADFIAKYEAYDDALKPTKYRTNTTIADDERDYAYRTIRAYVKAYQESAELDKSKMAKEVFAIFEKYGDIANMPQTQKTGALENLIQDLYAKNNYDKLLDLKAWKERLKNAEDAFIRADQERLNETANIVIGQTLYARNDLETAYFALCDKANACALVLGEESYLPFIVRVNAIIDEQKKTLRHRSTMSDKSQYDDNDENNDEVDIPENDENQ